VTGMSWTDGAERVAAPVSGQYATNVPWRLVLHSTEGGSVEGAVAAYKGDNVWPHATVDIRARRWVQHIPYDRPARALKHPAGTGETNKARALQLELVGFAAQSQDWAKDDLDWLGRMLAPLVTSFDIQPVSPTFYGAGAGWVLAVANARQRMSPQQWAQFNGICGHQHVPSNTHWDPGALDIGRVIAAITEGDDMPSADEVAEAVWNKLLDNKFGQQFAAKDIFASLDKNAADAAAVVTGVKPSRVPGKTNPVSFDDAVRNTDAYAFQQGIAQANLLSQVAAQAATIKLLAGGQGADVAAIQAAAEAGAKAALEGFTLTLSKDD